MADLDAAIDHWVTHAHVGPWTVFRGVTLNGRYAGADTVVTMDVAMGYTGDLQIELMQITSSTPSPYANSAGEPLVGPHHIAWITDDLDAALADARGRGLDELFVAEGPGRASHTCIRPGSRASSSNTSKRRHARDARLRHRAGPHLGRIEPRAPDRLIAALLPGPPGPTDFRIDKAENPIRRRRERLNDGQLERRM